jgi:hypothetical protein
MDPERKFLHDISSLFGTAFFVLDACLEERRGTPAEQSEEFRSLEQAYVVLDKVRQLVVVCRDTLVAEAFGPGKT